jgi:hypothetical protein
LFWHWARAAASRTFWTAGSSSPMSTAMIAITTKSSISVNAFFQRNLSQAMTAPPKETTGEKS